MSIYNIVKYLMKSCIGHTKEIRSSETSYLHDIDYTQDIINQKSINNIVKFIRFSNCGVFGCLLAVYTRFKFNVIVFYMEGIGRDPSFNIDFDSKTEKPTLIL